MNSQHNENGPTSRGNDFAGPGQPPHQKEVVVTDDTIQQPTDSEFNPGEGWREVRSGQEPGAERIIWSSAGSYNPDRVWVRTKPLPALPTEPYTVVWATWSNESSDAIVLSPEGWQFLGSPMTPDLRGITGFAVLSEPRAVTAKAVLDQVHNLTTSITSHLSISAISREFGVES